MAYQLSKMLPTTNETITQTFTDDEQEWAMKMLMEAYEAELLDDADILGGICTEFLNEQ